MAIALATVTSAISGTAVTWAGSKGVPATPVPPKHVLTPGFSLIEWFSERRPAAGQVDVVYARLWSKNKPIAGARLVATVKDGNRVLKVVVGGITNHRGQAEAGFIVPRLRHGTRIQVLVAMRFQGRAVTGSNTVTIR
jgi:hypothetical protein